MIHKRARAEALHNIASDLKSEMDLLDLEQLSDRANSSNWDDLTPQTGGRPIINLIVTSFRSGSHFMEEFLNTIPGTFVHHETLFYYSGIRLTNSELSKKAALDIQEILHCDYSKKHWYLWKAFIKSTTLSNNIRVWKHLSSPFQYSLDFISDACELFPVQVMKLTRLPLSNAEVFLQDLTLNLKLIYLVRDPRGMLLSRWDMCR